MTRKRYTEEQIIGMLLEGESDAKCEGGRVQPYAPGSEATHYNGKAKYASHVAANDCLNK